MNGGYHGRRFMTGGAWMRDRCVGRLRQERLAAMSVTNPWVGGVVRPATPADAAPIAACHNASWRETFGDQFSARFWAALDDATRTRMWLRLLSRPGAHRVVVAEAGGRIVGFAAAGPSYDDLPARETELHALYVTAVMHGTGVGQTLFDCVVAGRPCSLWVAEGNARALAFYRRQGFQPDGTRKTVTEWEGLVTIRMVR